MRPALKRFDDYHRDKLRDPEYAAAYLEVASEDGIGEFLIALRQVASAQEGGLKHVANLANISRERLLKALSMHGNPHVRTLVRILDAIGLRISVSTSHGDTTK